MSDSLANTPDPPYYGVVFTSLRSGDDPDGYAVAAERMLELAASQPGYLGVERASGDAGPAITVSYWRDLDSIRQWKEHAEHAEAQKLGKAVWYRAFRLRICRVEAENRFDRCEVDIREVSILSADAQALIATLDTELLGEYPVEHVHCVEFDTFHNAGGVFAIAYEADTPIGCGGLRPYNESQVEIKRMFVEPVHRGKGVSRKLVDWLEAKAAELGFSEIVLETGDKQLAAIGLYESCGYVKIDPFGEYTDGPYSTCYGKLLGR